MLFLAFETSCDDTAVGIVENGTNVLANVRQSQPEHNAYGGVVPEVAARLHAERWRGVLDQALAEACLSLTDVDALAVTAGPGLQTSLLTGTIAGSFLSQLHQIPLIPVQHIYGHLCSNFLERSPKDLKFPSLVLTVSGGHSDLYLWEDLTKVRKLGGTIDDAAGEAFDKVAKMLDLGYPGGPIVSKLAEKGDEKVYDLPRIYLDPESLDFSFSGLKAAVYRVIEEQKPAKISNIPDLCASFQAAVRDIFVKKLTRALQQFPHVQMLHFVGGVSANTCIRQALSKVGEAHGLELLTPKSFAYCTDNGAMIASAAYFLHQQTSQKTKIQFIDADPGLKMSD